MINEKPDLLRELVESMKGAASYEFSMGAMFSLWATGHLDLSKRWITADPLQRLYNVLDRVDVEVLEIVHTDVFEEEQGIYMEPELDDDESQQAETEPQTETA